MHNLPPMGSATPIVKIQDNHELDMAKAQVYKAAKCALELHKMLKYVDNLEGWMQAKITLASEYLDCVASNLEYDIVSATMTEPTAAVVAPAGEPVGAPMSGGIGMDIDMEPEEVMMQEQFLDPKEMGKEAQSLTVGKDGKVQNPHKPGTPEYAKWEQGKREAANKPGQATNEAMFPELRKDLGAVGKTIKTAAQRAWHGTPEENEQEAKYMHDAWIRSLTRKGVSGSEAQQLADKMMSLGIKPPMMDRLKEGKRK